MFSLSSFSKLKVKKMSLVFAPMQASKMKVWTFLGFEQNSVAFKNSFNSFFYQIFLVKRFGAMYWRVREGRRREKGSIKFNKLDENEQNSE